MHSAQSHTSGTQPKLKRGARSIMGIGVVSIRALACSLLLSASALAQQPAPLRPVATVPLPHVEGRIDHMAIDVAGERLFVAALGNKTLEVIAALLSRSLYGLCCRPLRHGRYAVNSDYRVCEIGRTYLST